MGVMCPVSDRTQPPEAHALSLLLGMLSENYLVFFFFRAAFWYTMWNGFRDPGSVHRCLHGMTNNSQPPQDEFPAQ